MPEDKNRLHYGDNLSVLRGKNSEGRPYIPDQSVDLIYLDPPFNSRQDYNVLFAEKDGSRSCRLEFIPKIASFTRGISCQQG